MRSSVSALRPLCGRPQAAVASPLLRHRVAYLLSSCGCREQSSASAHAASPIDLGSSTYSPVRTRDVKRRELVDEMIRVDHAGEVGAVQIYAGQMWALRGTKDYELIKVSSLLVVHLRPRRV